MAKSKIAKKNQAIAETITSGFTKISDGVVDGFNKMSDGVVGSYKKIEDKFVSQYLTKEGESVEEAKERLKNEENVRKEQQKINKGV